MTAEKYIKNGSDENLSLSDQEYGCIFDWNPETDEHCGRDDYECARCKYYGPLTEKERSFSDLVKEVHENAVAHGFWSDARSFGEIIALCHSELSEALEEHRKGKSPDEVYYREDGKPEGIGTELADVVIRIMDYCGHARIDLQKMIEMKHEFNKTRPYKHGGKVI